MTITTETITRVRVRVRDRQRADFVDALFGISFPLQLEPCIFAIASELSTDYRGAFWLFYSLSNGGFHMTPNDDARFTVRCENGYEGAMSADAFGITACLYAFSRLSFVATGNIAEVYARHYGLLREYAMDHAEVAAIIAATD
jgi:Antirestriction protein